MINVNHLRAFFKILIISFASVTLLTGFFFESAQEKAKKAVKQREYEIRQYKIEVRNTAEAIYKHLEYQEVAALRSKKSLEQFKFALATLIAEHLVAERHTPPDDPD
jgi:uncharacterized protein YlxW (UPF0749 family)